ncbi:hypothetical protein GCM10007901_09230 [Dyella acidisoli]|uniref:Transposase n=1 Tax=Dyella acidisoli TaxID=1867834 RepID=A0ABQ5XK06_9GAMM|nr:hypothetical protein GCM10007901_09230 [Dyella acidisoli]
MPRLQSIGPEQIASLLLLNKLAACGSDAVVKEQGIKRAPRLNLKEEPAVTAIIRTHHFRSARAWLVTPEILNEAVSQLMMMFGTFLGSHSFHRGTE